MARALRIGIVGAGLGGLVAAVALRRAGFEVALYEQAAQFGEVGAGIQIAPNAVKIFRALGLEPGLRAIACEPDSFVGRSWRSGRLLFRTPSKGVVRARFGADYYQVHRVELHALLRSALPDDAFHLGARCTGIEPTPNGVTLTFADRSAIPCDVVIGADGIHSTMRGALFGADQPRFTGIMCWRGQVPVEQLPPGLLGTDSLNWMGPGGSVVHYPVRNGTLVNYIAHRKTDQWADESWMIEGDRRELLADFEGWHDSLLRLFAATERCFKWALFDREPLPRWSVERVTLLGDAAHPMLPFLAQGGAMAMEDGFVLARLLDADRDDPAAALQRYQELRRPRTARVQQASRARAEICQVRSPLAQLWRDTKLRYNSRFNPSAARFRSDWVFGYDVTADLATLAAG